MSESPSGPASLALVPTIAIVYDELWGAPHRHENLARLEAVLRADEPQRPAKVSE